MTMNPRRSVRYGDEKRKTSWVTRRIKMKKLTAFVLICLLILAALSGCGKVEWIHYNDIGRTGEDGIRDIEDSYTKGMDIDEFESLTGLPVRESLPEAYQAEPLSVLALYDKDDKIINLTVTISNGSNDDPAAISVYSPDIWSASGYSPVGDKYSGSANDDLEISKIGMVTSIFYRYDNSKAQDKLGHDVYIAQFKLNSLIIYVESGAMSQDDFEQLSAALISVGNV